MRNIKNKEWNEYVAAEMADVASQLEEMAREIEESINAAATLVGFAAERGLVNAAHFKAYVFDQIMEHVDNGNPYNSSIMSTVKDIRKNIKIADGTRHTPTSMKEASIMSKRHEDKSLLEQAYDDVRSSAVYSKNPGTPNVKADLELVDIEIKVPGNSLVDSYLSAAYSDKLGRELSPEEIDVINDKFHDWVYDYAEINLNQPQQYSMD